MTKLSKSEIREELTINLDMVENLTGFRPKLFRPPYGYYNNNLIEICEDLNLSCIEWSVDSLDWKGLTASELSGRVISKSKKGSIVLFHNNSDNIIEGLKMCLEYFKNNETNVVPIGEMICYQDFYIDNQGAQIKK
jgi:peptidoglycan/xylan/chitin deacetylase (PgdA/CDA1 family)